MNAPEPDIEGLLRLAPRPAPPRHLKSRLIADMRLPAEARPSSNQVQAHPRSWLRRWWPVLAPAALSLAFAAALTVQQRQIQHARLVIQNLSDSHPAAVVSPPATAPEISQETAVTNSADAWQPEIGRLKQQKAQLAEAIAQLEAEKAKLRAWPSDPADMTQAGDGPRIRFAATKYDWGKAREGDQVANAFKFSNVGNATLKITSVVPSCGCTHAGEWTRQVQPGETGIIPIQFDTSHYSGSLSKSVAVTCNDPGHPLVYLQLTGSVWKPFGFQELLNIPITADSPSNSIVTSITNNMENAVVLTAPEVDNPAFTAELRTLEPGRVFELYVSASPPPGSGSALTHLTIETSSTDQPEIRVRAFASALSDVPDAPENRSKNLVIYCKGEFVHPGAFVVPRGFQPTVVTMIVRAGVKDRADLSKVTVQRLVNGQPQLEELNVEEIIRGQTGSQSDLSLSPGDTITVPARRQ